MAHLKKMETEIQELKDSGVNWPPPYQYPSDYLEYKWLPFKKPGNEERVTAWLKSFMDLWFKRDEVLNFFGAIEVHNNNIFKSPEVSDRSEPFPCQPGTKWKDVSITLVDFETVRIKMPGRKERFTYHELKMADKRTKEPRLMWQLLVAFANYSGRISADTPIGSELKDKLPSLSKTLNKHMKDLFGIEDRIYLHPYKKEHAYITKIAFNDETIYSTEKNPSVTPSITKGASLCEKCERRDSCTELCDEFETTLFDDEVADTIRKSNISESQLYQD